MLASIRRYPVKSLGGQALRSVWVDRGGIPGDRGEALFVRSGHARTGKTYRGKEHERLHLTDRTPDALALGAGRGVELEVRDGQHFFDDAPISLLVDRWMSAMNGALGYAVEPDRFRSNFFIRACDDFASMETELVGARLWLGELHLEVRCPIERCVAITYHPRGEASDPEILRYIAQRRNAYMGVYCDVLRPGTVRLNDCLATT